MAAERDQGSRDLNRVCAETYAATSGVPLDVVVVHATPQRIHASSPSQDATNASSAAVDHPTLREAAAALLRQRLLVSTATAERETPRSQPLWRRFPANDAAGSYSRQPMDLEAYEREATAQREAALLEKRAHVSLLRQQMEAHAVAAQHRVHETKKVMRAEQRRHHERIHALVTTGEDHPLERRDTGSRPSPYQGHDATQDDTSYSGGRRQDNHNQQHYSGWNADCHEGSDDDGDDADGDDYEAMYDASLAKVERRLRLNAEQRARLQHDDDDASDSGNAVKQSQRTKQLATTVSRVSQAVEAQRQRVAQLRSRLAASGIETHDVICGEQKRSKSAAMSSSSCSSPPAVSPSLYPAHVVVGPAAKAKWDALRVATTPTPTIVNSSKIKPLDSVVEKRLYPMPRPFQGLPPVNHDISLRTQSIHANKEPIHGDVLPSKAVKKPEFTDATVKRVAVDDVNSKKATWAQIEALMKHQELAAWNAERLRCGMAPIHPPAINKEKASGDGAAVGASANSNPPADGDDDDRPPVDPSGLPWFNKAKAKRLHDDAMSHKAATHRKLADDQFDKMVKAQFHAARKLQRDEQVASASRLHDESVASIKRTMQKAVKDSRAHTDKVATLFAKRSSPQEIGASFARVAEVK